MEAHNSRKRDGSELLIRTGQRGILKWLHGEKEEGREKKRHREGEKKEEEED